MHTCLNSSVLSRRENSVAVWMCYITIYSRTVISHVQKSIQVSIRSVIWCITYRKGKNVVTINNGLYSLAVAEILLHNLHRLKGDDVPSRGWISVMKAFLPLPHEIPDSHGNCEMEEGNLYSPKFSPSANSSRIFQ